MNQVRASKKRSLLLNLNKNVRCVRNKKTTLEKEQIPQQTIDLLRKSQPSQPSQPEVIDLLQTQNSILSRSQPNQNTKINLSKEQQDDLQHVYIEKERIHQMILHQQELLQPNQPQKYKRFQSKNQKKER